MADVGVAEDVVVDVRVTRGHTGVARDDDPFAIVVDDVVVDRGALRVGVQLDPAAALPWIRLHSIVVSVAAPM